MFISLMKVYSTYMNTRLMGDLWEKATLNMSQDPCCQYSAKINWPQKLTHYKYDHIPLRNRN